MNVIHCTEVPDFKEHECTGELWGSQLPNGSWTGLVGTFERGEGDIGAANLFMTVLGGRDEYQGYTTPYGQEVITVYLLINLYTFLFYLFIHLLLLRRIVYCLKFVIIGKIHTYLPPLIMRY